MLTKEDFIDFINLASDYDDELTRWSDFGIDLFDLPIADLGWSFFSTFLRTHFNENGRDWINWYMWERISIVNGEVLPCYDENDQKFYINSPEDLWELVKDKLIDYVDDEACDTKSDIS